MRAAAVVLMAAQTLAGCGAAKAMQPDSKNPLHCGIALSVCISSPNSRITRPHATSNSA